MKVSVEKRFLRFLEYTDLEFREVSNLLSWPSDKGPTETIIFKDSRGFYTFWGALKLIEHSIPYLELEIVDDDRCPPEPSLQEVPENLLPGITFYDFQIAAIQRALRFKTGIEELPTGSGKTEVIFGLLRMMLDLGLVRQCILVVPSVALALQTHDRALKRGFSESEVGVLHGGQKDFDCPIVIAVINSLSIGLKEYSSSKKKLEDIRSNIQKHGVDIKDKAITDIIDKHSINLRKYQVYEDLVNKTNVLIYDECHHLRSETNRELALRCRNAEYLLGFSGSPFHEDSVLENPGDTVIYGLTGGKIYSISYSYLRSIGLISESYLYFETIPGKLSKYRAPYAQVYNTHVVNNEYRNERIIYWTSKFVRLGFKTLIMVQRKEHAKILLQELSQFKAISVFGGSGGLSLDEYDQVEEISLNYDQLREDFESGTYEVLICSQVMDEGFDLPSVGAAILAGGGRSRIKLQQRTGRAIRRKKTGINRVYLIDFQDLGHVYLQSQYKKRRIMQEEEIQSVIFEDQQEFLEAVVSHARGNENDG